MATQARTVSEEEAYPLTPEWIADPKTCPSIPSFASFDEGVRWAAAQLVSVGFVAFEYGCLSGFQVSIYSLDRLPQLPRGVSKAGREFFMVAVGCGSYGGIYPQPIRVADPGYVGEKLNLLADDAKAIAYLLRQVGSHLPERSRAA